MAIMMARAFEQRALALSTSLSLNPYFHPSLPLALFTEGPPMFQLILTQALFEVFIT